MLLFCLFSFEGLQFAKRARDSLSPTMDLLDDSESGFFLCAAPQNSRTMGKHSSETNSHTQDTNSRHILHRSNHLFSDYRPNDQGGNSVPFLGPEKE